MPPVYYNSSQATSDNQTTQISTLSQILTAIQALSTDPTLLQAILTALGPAATAALQTTGNTTLSSILSALAPLSTSAGQATGNASLASILSAFAPLATAASQATGNASLASIDAKIGSSTAVISSVAQSASTSVLLAANANRKGFALYNESTIKAFVAMSGTATAAAYSVLLAPSSGYEPIQTAIYRGAISAIWASGTGGAMRVTEFT